jgi:hypothetical protein
MTQKELELIQIAHFLNTHPWAVVLIVVLSIWVIIWKGTALWKAAKKNSKAWYIVLLLLNTVGILEILYIFYFSKKQKQ